MKVGQPVKGCNPPISPIEVYAELVPSVKPSLFFFSWSLFHIDAGNSPFPVQWESQGILPRNRRQVGHDPSDGVHSFPLSLCHLVWQRGRLQLHPEGILGSLAGNASLRDFSTWGTSSIPYSSSGLLKLLTRLLISA